VIKDWSTTGEKEMRTGWKINIMEISILLGGSYIDVYACKNKPSYTLKMSILFTLPTVITNFFLKITSSKVR
jgi:hypothetical protein